MGTAYIGNDWDNILKDVFEGEEFAALAQRLKQEYATQTIYPFKQDVFNALKLTPHASVKVVILGQDPYINGEAHGLCFSVKQSYPLPPSLKNIFKEQLSDLGIENKGGDLSQWARQGVLLLNACLTVRAGLSRSHKDIGWRVVTDRVMQSLRGRGIIFVLWGNDAKAYIPMLPNECILKAAHPSPLSANNGFFGCKHFSQINEILQQRGDTPIDWRT